MKVAKLVYSTFVTRVIVDENATEEEILEATKSKLMDQVKYDLSDNLEEIKDDLDVPYSQNEGKPIDQWEKYNKDNPLDRVLSGSDRGK